MLRIGSFFTNSRKPPCGFTPLFACVDGLNLVNGLYTVISYENTYGNEGWSRLSREEPSY